MDVDFLDNYGEYVAGTDPNDPGSVFRFPYLQRDAGGITLSWTVESARQYRVHTLDLFTGLWTAKTGWMDPTVGVNQMSWTNPVGGDTYQIYVIEVRLS